MQRKRYTEELLENILQQGNAILLERYTKYTQRMIITFQCSCGSKTTKRFEMLNMYRYPYCNNCTLKRKEAKRVKTSIREYGVINTAQLPSIITKIKNTNIQKYKCHPKNTVEVQQKWAATCLERYGGHPNQNAEVQAKSEKTSFAYKDYMMPNGTIVKYQGYENLALDELVKIYEEEDISIGRSNVPIIIYYIDDNKHVYFPDFYIKSENKIIEVKSEWTLQLYRANIEEKTQATINSGYNFELWIYNSKKEKISTLIFAANAVPE